MEISDSRQEHSSLLAQRVRSAVGKSASSQSCCFFSRPHADLQFLSQPPAVLQVHQVTLSLRELQYQQGCICIEVQRNSPACKPHKENSLSFYSCNWIVDVLISIFYHSNTDKRQNRHKKDKFCVT